MAIDAERLEQQRAAVEELRHQTELDRAKAARVEAAVARRRAELEAVELGLRVECKRGCGAPVGKRSRTGVCTRCLRTEWQRKARGGLRLVPHAEVAHG